MNPKVQEKEKAIKLRRKGYTYNEILKILPIAKSSLSLWLKDLPLTEYEKHYLKTRANKNISLGRIRAAAANRRNRIERDRVIFLESKSEFDNLIKDPFFQVGLTLYWAEGTKRTSVFQFVNSDTDMIALMIKWIKTFLNIPKEKIFFRLYIHKPYAHENCEKYWSKKSIYRLLNSKKLFINLLGSVLKKDRITKVV